MKRRSRRETEPGKLGSYLRKLRLNKGLLLEQVAKEIGFSTIHVSEVERGIKKPSDEFLKNIAKFYNVSEEELFLLAGKFPPSIAEEILESDELRSLIIEIAKNRNLSEEKKQERYKMIAEFLKEISDDE